jgi:hypothetical protein
MSEFNPVGILERLRGPGSTLPTGSSRKSVKDARTPVNPTMNTINSNMSSTRDNPGSPGVKQSGNATKSSMKSSSSRTTISGFDGGDSSKLGQSHLQPGPNSSMTYYDQRREKGTSEIRDELELEVGKLRNELSKCRKENKQLKDD